MHDIFLVQVLVGSWISASVLLVVQAFEKIIFPLLSKRLHNFRRLDLRYSFLLSILLFILTMLSALYLREAIYNRFLNHWNQEGSLCLSFQDYCKWVLTLSDRFKYMVSFILVVQNGYRWLLFQLPVLKVDTLKHLITLVVYTFLLLGLYRNPLRIYSVVRAMMLGVISLIFSLYLYLFNPVSGLFAVQLVMVVLVLMGEKIWNKPLE